MPPIDPTNWFTVQRRPAANAAIPKKETNEINTIPNQPAANATSPTPKIPAADGADTYSGISAIQRAADAEMRKLKPGLEAEIVLVNGAVPALAGGPWQSTDLLGREPPTGQKVDGSDPSGSRRWRGPG